MLRVFALVSIALFAGSGVVPARDISQLILSIAPTWDSGRGHLQLFEKIGKTWHPASPVIPVLYGKNGLAWGCGVHPLGLHGTVKREGDKKTPAGIFKVGKIYTFDRALPDGAQYPFWTITKNCAWIDDSTHPLYNQHVTVDPNRRPQWFAKQRMRHNDAAHRWLVEIRHNSDPPVAYAGSAIFFHIRRGPDRKTAGCTVMESSHLEQIIKWLQVEGNPHYAILPEAEYKEHWKGWKLPSPQVASNLLHK